MKNREEAIRHELGGVFADKENSYFNCGNDWWSVAYLPKYPESTAADVIIYGNPSQHRFSITGNLQSMIPTIIRFNTFGDLCDYLREANT